MDSLTARILRCNPSRCDHCGGRLECFEGEFYCPGCVHFTIPAEGQPWADLGLLDADAPDGGPNAADLIDLSRCE